MAVGVPGLSIVVPVHGVAAYLPECLDSLLAGAPDRVEIVAVDDASPDTCGEILDDYARRDHRVRPLHLARNVGLGPARNAGLGRANGEYVWFVDGDDMVPAGAVHEVAGALARLRPEVLMLGHAMLSAAGVPHAVRRLGAVEGVRVAERPALLRTRQAAWNRVVRRSLLERTGVRFPPGWYEDVPFSYLVLLAAERVSCVDGVSYLYRQRGGGGVGGFAGVGGVAGGGVAGGGAITATPSPRHFEVFRQYERLFATCTAWRAPPWVRARLFARMIEHYLVILGCDDRVPPDRRAEFFARMVAHYRRYLPPEGYPVPGGMNGFKHELVRRNSYRLFATLRTAYRARFARS